MPARAAACPLIALLHHALLGCCSAGLQSPPPVFSGEPVSPPAGPPPSPSLPAVALLPPAPPSLPPPPWVPALSCAQCGAFYETVVDDNGGEVQLDIVPSEGQGFCVVLVSLAWRCAALVPTCDPPSMECQLLNSFVTTQCDSPSTNGVAYCVYNEHLPPSQPPPSKPPRLPPPAVPPLPLSPPSTRRARALLVLRPRDAHQFHHHAGQSRGSRHLPAR